MLAVDGVKLGFRHQPHQMGNSRDDAFRARNIFIPAKIVEIGHVAKRYSYQQIGLCLSTPSWLSPPRRT
jgi:hypothetical protein